MLLLDLAKLAPSAPSVPKEFVYRGKHYSRTAHYPKSDLTRALAECRQSLDDGTFCIVVEGGAQIALYGESGDGPPTHVEVVPAASSDPVRGRVAEVLAKRYSTGDRNFGGMNLQKQNLSGLDLRKANLSGAKMQGVNLDGANLEGANLSGAQLLDASLRKTDLRSSNLTKANLKGANISGTKLTGARLRGATMPDGTTS